MSLWKDNSGGMHDDMDGQAISLPIWPQGMVQITQAEADVLLAPPPPTIEQQILAIEAANPISHRNLRDLTLVVAGLAQAAGADVSKNVAVMKVTQVSAEIDQLRSKQ